MSELEEALRNPFSPEKAYMDYLKNMSEAERLRDEVDRAMEAGGADERELLLKATQALGYLTDNSVVYKVVRKALEGRDGEKGAPEEKVCPPDDAASRENGTDRPDEEEHG